MHRPLIPSWDIRQVTGSGPALLVPFQADITGEPDRSSIYLFAAGALNNSVTGYEGQLAKS